MKNDFIGSSVLDITKIMQSDVFKKVHQSIVGTVNVLENETLKIGTLLHSADGGKTWDALRIAPFEVKEYSLDEEVYFEGHIFKSTADNNNTPTTGDWEDLGEWNPNGILYNNISSTTKTTVAITADLISKQLHGLDEFLAIQLFNNKLLTK